MAIQIEGIGSLDFENLRVGLTDGSFKNFDIGAALAIDEFDLNKSYIEQPGKYAWWASLAESAKGYRDEMEAELERAEARADRRVRQNLELDGVKVTEKIVESRIKLDEEFIAAQNTYLKAKRNAAILDKVQKAFDQRLDSLISLGANKRKEEDNSEVSMPKLKEKARNVVRSKETD